MAKRTPTKRAAKSDSSIFNTPLVTFNRELTGILEPGLRREWLVTNGIGGYASGTVTGVLTRSYHGLLVAALDPPVERTVLVATLDESATYEGVSYPLSTHEFGDGVINPEGYRNISTFHLEGTLPVWTFELGSALLERRVWMDYGRNTTHVSYRVVQGESPVELAITPLVTYHSFHALAQGNGWNISVERHDSEAIVIAGEGLTPFALQSNDMAFTGDGAWWWNFRHREETARGLQDHGDLFAIGRFSGVLEPGQTAAITLSSEVEPGLTPVTSLEAERKRQRGLLQTAAVTTSSLPIQQLVLAADQVIVARPLPDEPNGRSVIAGYHWFNDWGRDTMIALPGLFLSTGRAAEAEKVLRTFAQYVQDGLLPNNFPDHAGAIPGYNTADATLWYILAIDQYERTTGDRGLVDDLQPTLISIIDHHLAGTRYHIGVDPVDGLLRAGEPGVQLTWMDAKVGDWVVTPRIGKPVEINALWYNVLRTMSRFLSERDDDERATRYQEMADFARGSFERRFMREGENHLADVVDGPDGDDWSVRPNQIFAFSLPYPLIDHDAETILGAIGESLLTDYGLRSLTPSDHDYRGTYGGDQLHRDGAYHQGPVWGWLLGPYVEATYRLTGDKEAALALLRPMISHLSDAGLGSISEIFEGDPPYEPRGCVAQAWSVAESLRVWRMLDADSAQ